MDGEAPYRHPVDYEVHPRAGAVFLVWGAISITVAVWRSQEPLGLWTAYDALMGVGIMLFGAALRTPAGTARRWLLRAWLGSLLLLIAIPAGVHLLRHAGVG